MDKKNEPYKLENDIAKVVNRLLETISSAHITYSGDFINRIKSLHITNKNLARSNIKSVYTNIAIAKCLRHFIFLNVKNQPRTTTYYKNI